MAGGVLIVALLAVGCTDSPPNPDATPRPSPETTSVAVQPPVDPTTPAPEAAAPVRVSVPRLDIDSRLDRLGLRRGGELATPQSFTRAAWYSTGVVPGDTGPAVIVGHVDSRRGPAVFFALRHARRGDDIRVTDADGVLRHFTVTAVRRYAKAAFGTSQVYGPTVGPELRLITCTGTFDSAERSYRDNLVVFARIPVQRAG